LITFRFISRLVTPFDTIEFAAYTSKLYRLVGYSARCSVNKSELLQTLLQVQLCRKIQD